ncbi:hypothetical protein [Helicobacter sp. MIT 01-3238]|uniref:hypothetical protein n=1 Tax=Helicobacter sp. MIT 01-3238 TaxID=398627 RepID=UPI000E1F1E75|nr:hypothetical protein [Helicobacter sp. MIT 01-3238]RDU55197.1 hypothetical protein CQA40_01865 [Helicobacter sp. MIT 01-3238]
MKITQQNRAKNSKTFKKIQNLAFKLACVGVFTQSALAIENLQSLDENDKKAQESKKSKELGVCGKKSLLDEVRLNIKNNLLNLKMAHLLEKGSTPFPSVDSSEYEATIKRLRSINMGCDARSYSESAQCLYNKLKDEKLKADFGEFAKRLSKINMTFDAQAMSRDLCSVRGISVVFDGGDKASYDKVDVGYTPRAYNDKGVELISFSTSTQGTSINSKFAPFASIITDIENYYSGRGVMINNSLRGGCPNGSYTTTLNPKDKLSQVYSCAGGLFRSGITKEISKEKLKNKDEKDNIVIAHYQSSGGALIVRKYAITKYIDEQRFNSIGQNKELYTKAYQKASQRIKPPTLSKAEKDLEKFKEQALSGLNPDNIAQNTLEKVIDEDWQAYQEVQDYNAKRTTKVPDEKTLKMAKAYQQKEEKQQKQLAEMRRISQEWNNKILAYKQKLEEETKKEYAKILQSYQEPRIDTEEQILAFIKKEKLTPIYESIETADLRIVGGEEFYSKCEPIEETCNAKFQTGCKIIGKKCGVVWNNNSPKKGLGGEYKTKYKELIEKSHFKDEINANLDALNPSSTEKKESNLEPQKAEPAPTPQEQILQPIDILRF